MKGKVRAPAEAPLFAWKIGQVVQGLVLGILLIFAAIGWVANYGNVAAFKYQGF